MKFSICIPNYNYARYLGRTIQSVLDQTYGDFEILVSDNASTDDSAAVVESICDSRIRLTKNRCNVGFAANLDRAARHATGDFMILLSSDDVMRPTALDTYATVLNQLGRRAETTVLSSSTEIIDENDRPNGEVDLLRGRLWRETDVDNDLSTLLNHSVFQLSADELLARSMARMANPFAFCATAYPRKLYDSIEGYGGNRLIGPDKWFHWRLLAAAESAILVRTPLFGYRVHSQNQLSQQSQSNALKYLVDGYLNSFESDPALLAKARLSRVELERAFIEYDIVRHGMALLGEGKRTLSRRTLNFGRAAYPHHVRRSWKAWGYRMLLAAGPLGSIVAAELRRRFA